TWESLPPSTKRSYFLTAAQAIESNKDWRDKARELIKQELGFGDLWIDINFSASVSALREAASICTGVGITYVLCIHPGARVVQERRAAGVAFGICPWNAPLNLTIRAFAIPLATGNTVVLKSSELCPKTQQHLIDLLHSPSVGIPPEALSIFHCSRAEAPALVEECVRHEAVRRINFTGSAKVGSIIASLAGKHLKQGIYELGGSAPVLVLPSASSNILTVAHGILTGALLHSGQVCMSSPRVLVHSSIKQSLVDELVKGFKSVEGKGKLGQLTMTEHEERVRGWMEDAVRKGGRMVVHGKERGWIVDLDDVPVERLKEVESWNEEVFGPVIHLRSFTTTSEALDLANSSPYSLCAAVWSSDVNEALEVASCLRVGTVQVNGGTVHVESANGVGNMGLGGASGYGRFCVDAFTDLRTVVIHPKEDRYPFVEH
ncbi:aldehyde dehydrogenase family protein, partial [Atractiella rhizophila]